MFLNGLVSFLFLGELCGFNQCQFSFHGSLISGKLHVCLISSREQLFFVRENVVVVPLRIAKVQQGHHRHKKIQTELEDFKIWSTHDVPS